MSRPSGPDEPPEILDERAGSPESLDEIFVLIRASVDEIVSILERRAARHG